MVWCGRGRVLRARDRVSQDECRACAARAQSEVLRGTCERPTQETLKILKVLRDVRLLEQSVRLRVGREFQRGKDHLVGRRAEVVNSRDDVVHLHGDE